METDEAIRLRASARSYGFAKVDDSVVKELLELAMQAPSAGNTEEWVFIVIKGTGTKQALAEASFGRKFISDAPAIIVFCADMGQIEKRFGERGTSLYAGQDVAAAVQTLMVAATARNLSTCWIGDFNEQLVKNILAIPQGIRPLSMVTLGYAKDRPKKPQRKQLSDVAFSEAYGKPFK
jgi:nitroreductase